MGERRITIPLYLCAGLVNAYNAAMLLAAPNLHNAFLMWGSINTFVFVRLQLFLLSLAVVDWSLVYTFALIAAAGVTYPLTRQSVHTFWITVCFPALYAPFHERVCVLLRWEPDDTDNAYARRSMKDTHVHDRVGNIKFKWPSFRFRSNPPTGSAGAQESGMRKRQSWLAGGAFGQQPSWAGGLSWAQSTQKNLMNAVGASARSSLRKFEGDGPANARSSAIHDDRCSIESRWSTRSSVNSACGSQKPQPWQAPTSKNLWDVVDA